jgi:hypothetical protein
MQLNSKRKTVQLKMNNRYKTYFQGRHINGQKVHKNTTSAFIRKIQSNCNEIKPYPGENGYYEKDKSRDGERNLSTLLVRM